MKNIRNICLALVIPFGVSALAFAASSIIIKPVEKDITDIDWNYRDMEGYSLLAGRQPLEATAVYDDKYPLSSGNELVWSVTNPEGKEIGEIQSDATGQFYFNPLAVGKCVLVCSNEKGTINRSFTAQVFAKGAIILNPDTATSGRSISGIFRYGMEDFTRNDQGELTGRKEASASFSVDVVGDSGGVKNLEVVSKSDSIAAITFQDERAYVSFAGPGEATFTLRDKALGDDEVAPLDYEFEIVDGVNIYSYDDLMDATNRSDEAENVVLRTNFGSLSDLYQMDEKTGRPLVKNHQLVPLDKPRKDTVLFGHYDAVTDTFSFDKDTYAFAATLKSPFIQAWNENGDLIRAKYKQYKPYDETVRAGIHLRGNLYGNGFTINLHNLAFPYEIQYRTDEAGNKTQIISLRDDNLFRGPKTFFAYGDPDRTTSPIIAYLGQDNSGIFVDTDNVVISDVQIQNCDFGDNFENLRFTGTVLDIEAADVRVEDSILTSGRNVVRAYSAPDLTIENCLLENGYENLLKVGSNELAQPDENREVTFTSPASTAGVIPNYPSTSIKGTLRGFDGTRGDEIFTSYLTTDANLSDIITLPIDSLVSGPYVGKVSTQGMLDAVEAAGRAYDASYAFVNDDGTVNYGSTVSVKDTSFYRSGIASISADQVLNGPYLWSLKPSNFTAMMSLLKQFNNDLVFSPLVDAGKAAKLSRTMQPSSIEVSGDSRFYDWKDGDQISIVNTFPANYQLLQEKVTSIKDLTLDDLYPLPETIVDSADAKDADGVKYVNIPAMIAGGGTNISKITFAGLTGISDARAVDVVKKIMTRDFKSLYPVKTAYSTVNLIGHSITTFTGFEPYQIYSATANYSIGIKDAPNIADLQNRHNS
ncbi:MAG TPA: hypothetical protein DEA32_00635 [Firmicutes bacterium]|nr:hypothetical protein [Bacillota bacterium]